VNKFAKTDYLSLEGYSFQGFKNVDTNSKHPIVFPRIIVQKVIPLDDDENTLFKVKNNSILYNENYEKQIARNALELNLSRKIITNNSHKSFKCRQSSNLTLYKRIHTGYKPYKCDQCEYKCSDSSAFKRHKRIHLKEKL
jgi:hypothetical protein